MFDFSPMFLYVYELVELVQYVDFPVVRFSIPSFSDGTFKNSPPKFPSSTGTYPNIFKYFFSFSFAKNVYDYVDFGRISGTYNPTKRTGYRGYNKGKFINNSFQWYAYYEEKNFSTGNITEYDNGENRAEYQLNKSGCTYYWLVF